ncbi:hypothetical protein JCM17844_13770 [Iodidimonas gelatinilytica]|uniref:Uncharacterized protein n=1 Tax=Iodidimonas gelatinilytica TaxID=1236966 RepID=A0A5A7MP22_9PROT|nr:hypothetical protein [Iodidimonas gelatinilytica]GEQ97740.1 hypothetical protein JCM17844_13770 [Iodidimonas gelatinilytica]
MIAGVGIDAHMDHVQGCGRTVIPTHPFVIPGLDPGIQFFLYHTLRQAMLDSGSSPGVTDLDGYGAQSGCADSIVLHKALWNFSLSVVTPL